eukprot:scaffold379_cov235-Pinguiococcus_pyrenoidosus.AAC.3
MPALIAAERPSVAFGCGGRASATGASDALIPRRGTDQTRWWGSWTGMVESRPRTPAAAPRTRRQE